jgi:hypothetical protein
MQKQMMRIRRAALRPLASACAIGFLGFAFLLAAAVTPSTASAQIALSVNIAPPALPVYSHPICPGEGYIWTPGYWSYSDDGGYYWVPGTWVEAPEPGLLWTPGYWGWNNGAYLWNDGYWGSEVGFYGGVDYGFGYIGDGYAGGYWRNNQFFYNSRVNNINVTEVHNVYQKTVVERGAHVSYNGGRGGITARPTAAQERFAHERHVPPASVQREHQTAARSNREQFASVNHGHPSVAATPKPGAYSGSGVVRARGATAAPTHPAASHGGSTSASRTHPATHESGASARTRTESVPHTASHSNSAPRTETKSASHQPAHEPKAASPRTETSRTTASKPAAKTHSETASHSTSTPRTESRPATHESKPVTHESQPATHEAKPAAHQSAPVSHTRTEPAPRAENKPATIHEPKPATQHTAPPAEHQPKPMAEHQSKPPAEQHAAPAQQHPAPAQHEPAPKEKKPPAK